MKWISTLTVTLLCLPLFGDTPKEPQIPEECEDSALKAVLMERQKAPLPPEVSVAKEEFLSKANILEKVVFGDGSEEAIDEAEKGKKEARNRYLKLVEAKGLCTTHPITAIDIPKGGETREQHWLISDGSCYFGGSLAKEELQQRYRKMFESLRKVKHYPKRSLVYQREHADEGSGFSHVFTFMPVKEDGSRWPKLPDGREDPNSIYMELNKPSFAFIGVEGIDFFGKKSFRYFFRNEPTEKLAGDFTEGRVVFLSRPLPSTSLPDVKDVTADGRKIGTGILNLQNVKGMWCLRSDGYLRYFTTADFGVLGTEEFRKIAEEPARMILLNTLVEMSERGGF